MRIKCPYCGERDAQEFTYRGAAGVQRPDPDAPGAQGAFIDYVYLRDNPAGSARRALVSPRRLPLVARRRARHAHARDRERRASLRPSLQDIRLMPADCASTGLGGSESGGLIDRTRTLSFTFDGRPIRGHPGDTLASALLANGVTLVGRSFKYHRPRGILTAGSEEPNALVELRAGARREPNTRATVAELYDGLVARSQNRWPSLAFDVLAVNQLFAPIFGAGFYYKTFMWPRGLLGVALRAGDPPRRRPGARLASARSRRLREGLRPLRRAGHRLGPDRPDGGAARRRAPARASSSRTRISSSAGGCLSEADVDRRASRPRFGLQEAPSPSSPPSTTSA